MIQRKDTLYFYDRSSKGPDLGPNCLQSYQQMTKVAISKEALSDQQTQNLMNDKRKLVFWDCEQQRPRLISAFVIRILGHSISKLATKQNFNFLASLCSWVGMLEHDLVGNPEDRFCCAKAHVIVYETVLDKTLMQKKTV